MANRLLSSSSKLANLRCCIRTLNSSPSSFSAVTPLNLADKPDETLLLSPKLPGRTTFSSSSTSIIDLDDVRSLFKSFSSGKLLRSSVNLHLAALEPLVDVGIWVMKSRLMETIVLREIVLETLRHTFFEHFCVGEDAEEAGKAVTRLWNSAGMRGMLVYAIENTADNATCDRNLEGFIRTVESTKPLPPSSASFVVGKITAICSIDLLKRVSDLLRWQHKNPSFHLPWKQNNFPIFADSSPFYHTLERPEPLTPEEEEDLQLAHQRLLKLCQKCLEANVPLSVDAEYTTVQPAIDYLTYCAAIEYNREKNNPIVYGTMQAYLKDAEERLLLAVQAADKLGVSMGFKLVRGAYLIWETQLASSLGYDSPIHNSLQETHACYNGCASFLLERIASGSGAVVLATHNIESGKLLATKARDLGILNEDNRVQFAQLYGMAESLSFGLRNAGFHVNKYMAFGPIQHVMPYLLRRAEENRGLLSSSSLDRYLMRKELKRRLKAVILGGGSPEM